jgi:hypothetical protein
MKGSLSRRAELYWIEDKEATEFHDPVGSCQAILITEKRYFIIAFKKQICNG